MAENVAGLSDEERAPGAAREPMLAMPYVPPHEAVIDESHY